MKTQNVTLAVTIDEKETVQTEYGTRYNVIIKRADNRKMELYVDYSVYEELVVGKPAIVDIEVVMEKEGDINHFDKEQTRIVGIRYLDNREITGEYADLLDKNLAWLSRYAPPIKEEGKKSPAVILIGLLFLLVGLAVGSIAPIWISGSLKDAEKYKDYVHVEGVVTHQENERLYNVKVDGKQGYRINATIQYSVDGKTYEMGYTINRTRKRLIDINQDIIHRKDNPEDAMVAFYDAVSRTYLPSGTSWFQLIGTILVSVVIGIPCILAGIYAMVCKGGRNYKKKKG